MRRILSAAVAGIVLVFLLFVSASYLVEERLKDLDRVLTEKSRTFRGESTFNINGRLALLRRRIEQGDSPIGNYALEARLQSLSSGFRFTFQGAQGAEPCGITCLFRWIDRMIGIPDRSEGENEDFRRTLEEAYYWERNRMYVQALILYQELSGSPAETESSRDAVRLHMAFCRTMTGDFEGAVLDCSVLLGESRDAQIRESAKRILDFIREFRSRRETARVYAQGSLERGVSEHYAVEYAAALTSLDAFLKDNPGHPRQSEARYFKGRSHEELGEVSAAVDEYRRVLLLDSGGPWRQEAQRRLIMLDAFYEAEGIGLEDLDTAESDPSFREFRDIVEKYSPLIAESALFPPAAREDPRAAGSVRSSGEVFVRTSPAGGLVTLNGRFLGPAPVFAYDVPFGAVNVEARYGGESRSLRVSVTDSRTVTVDINLLPSTGTLEISTDWRDIKVLLGEGPAVLRDGTVIESPPGEVILSVMGVTPEGKSAYWEDLVMVKAGERAVVQVP